MQVTCYRKHNLSYAIIDDYLTKQDHKEVLAEVKDLKRLAVNAEIISAGSAKDINGNYRNSGDGVFVDPLYGSSRTASPILCTGKKIFDLELGQTLEKFDVVFSFIRKSSRDEILINYYAPGQVYKTHNDICNITAITLLGCGDFTGGGFCFPEQDVEIKFKQGRTIVFPSCTEHCSESIEGPEGVYRASIAHFISN